ncbi:MAG: hypothetical protein CMG00_09175 [Candidatus Marinimicrobia bacterium]|nr:hypothetical protein [Candidatus Neomarinimicrobiota bacterium]
MILFISFFMFSLAFSSSDAVAAVVGNKIILKSSVQEQVNMFLQRSPSSSVVGLESSVLNHLIEQEVLVYFAEKDTSLLVDFSRADMIVDERFDFFKKNLGSVSAVEDYFGSSKTEIKDVLLKEARSLLLAESFKQKLYSGVSVSYNDVSSFYLSYKDSLPLTPFRYNYSIYALPSILKTPSLEKSFATADSVFAEIKKGLLLMGFIVFILVETLDLLGEELLYRSLKRQLFP